MKSLMVLLVFFLTLLIITSSNREYDDLKTSRQEEPQTRSHTYIKSEVYSSIIMERRILIIKKWKGKRKFTRQREEKTS